jgi:uncharacterized repeat protein (TIGR01451 family)
MSYVKNKLKFAVLFLIIASLVFLSMPSNLIGEGDPTDLEALQQVVTQATETLGAAQAAADDADSALADAQAAADNAEAVLAEAEQALADAQAALDAAGEDEDTEALEQALADADSALADAQAAADDANSELSTAQAAADNAEAALAEAEQALADAQAALDAAVAALEEEDEEVSEASLNVVANPESVEPDGSVTYKIVVKNTGDVALSDIEVNDTLPEIVIFESSSAGEFNEDSKEVSYTIDSLEPGEISEQEITVNIPIVAKELQFLTNLVTVSSEEIESVQENTKVFIITSEEEEAAEEEAEEEIDYNPFIYTDKEDYNPGEEVTIFGEGFVPDADVEITIYNAGGEVEHEATITADGNGEFVYKYNILGSTEYRVEARSVIKDESGKAEFLDSATYGWYSGGFIYGISPAGELNFRLDDGQTNVPAYCIDRDASLNTSTTYKLGDLPWELTAAQKATIIGITTNYPVEDLVFDGNSYSKNQVAAAINYAIWKVTTSVSPPSSIDSLVQYIYNTPSPGFSVTLIPQSAINYFPDDRDHNIDAVVGNSRITFKNVRVDFSTDVGTLNPTSDYTDTSSPYYASTVLHYSGSTDATSTISAAVSFPDYGLTTSTNVLYQYGSGWDDYDRNEWNEENGSENFWINNQYQRLIIPIISAFIGSATKTWEQLCHGSIIVTKSGMESGDLVSISLYKGIVLIETKPNVGDGVYTFSNLALGNDYTITETYASGNTYSYSAATQNPDNPLDVSSSTPVNVSLVNTPEKGSITVEKSGLMGSDTAIFSLNGPGGPYTSIELGDGGIDGWVDLPYGQYTVTETWGSGNVYTYTTDIGAGNQQVVDINAGNENPTVVVTNTPEKGSITICKTDKTNGEPILGSTFELWKESRNQAFVNPNGTGIGAAAFSSVGWIKIGEVELTNSNCYTWDDLPYGNYMVRETVAPQGYLLCNDVYVTVDGETPNPKLVEEIADPRKPGKIGIRKVDENGDAMVGAGFTLYNSTGTTVVQGEKFTDAAGNVAFGNLAWGSYLIVETTVPAGYTKVDDVAVIVNAGNAGTVINVTIKNTPGGGGGEGLTVLGIQELPFTGMNPAIPISSISMILGGLAMFIASLKKRFRRK